MAKKKAKTGVTINPDQLTTYYLKRMHGLGVTNPAEHYFFVEGEAEKSGYKQPIFQETDAGNILINYPSLFGGAEVVEGTETPFYRLRYKPENQPDTKVKYFQERGTGVHIFFPPVIVDKFDKKTPIPKLWLVEGEFKAFAGSLCGIDMVGMGGKDSFRDADKKGLHPDLLRLITDCRVESIGILTDADTLQVKWDIENDPLKDLSKSLWGFRSTVINFREACITAGLKDSYFAHLKLENLIAAIDPANPDAGKIKGLDDLIESRRAPGTINYITADLDKMAGAKAFFDCYNIGAMNPAGINKIFWLNPGRGGVPSSFYAANADLLRNHEFKFNGAVFKNNPETGLECLKHAESDKYIRIGCDYYKSIMIPDSNGDLQPSLEGWSAAVIQRDFGKSFFNGIEAYDANCNVPDNTANYQRVVNGCYNRYYPLTHQLTEGEYSTIVDNLKHLFGERELMPATGDSPALTSLDLILDYLTIMYRYPTQMLPIVVLYSAENNTGKSTGLWLLEDMFLSNYGEVNSDILEDPMNDDWCTKLAIGMDETIIDKNKIYQKLKSLSTAHSIMMRGMYAARRKVAYFAKIWMATNDRSFIRLEPNETRFFINQVPRLKKIDPDFRYKMKNEVPAFLYYLSNRDIKFPKTSRHWFAPDLLVTEMGKQIKENSKGWLQKELEAVLPDIFFNTKWHTLYYSLEELENLLNGRNKGTKYRAADIQDQLFQHYGLETKFARHKHPNDYDDDPDTQFPAQRGFTVKHKRCFTFHIENFVSEAKIRELSQFFKYEDVILTRLKPTESNNELL